MWLHSKWLFIRTKFTTPLLWWRLEVQLYLSVSVSINSPLHGGFSRMEGCILYFGHFTCVIKEDLAHRSSIRTIFYLEKDQALRFQRCLNNLSKVQRTLKYVLPN